MMQLNNRSDLPRLVLWSTNFTVANDIPSVTAIIETILAITLYWFVSITMNIYAPLIASAAIAPLFLLNSDASSQLGRKWFKHWENRAWQADRSFSKLNQWERLSIAVLAIFAGILSFISTYFLAGQFVPDTEGWNELLYAAVVGWLTIVVAVVTTATVITMAVGIEATPAGVLRAIFFSTICAGFGMLLISGPVAGVGAIGGAIFVTILAAIGALALRKARAGPWGTAVESTGVIISTLCLPITLGNMFGLVLMGWFIRTTATVSCIIPGVQNISRNLFRLMFCLSPLQIPELIPGLRAGDKLSTFSIIDELAAKSQPDSRVEKMLMTILFFVFFMPLIFIPIWLSRIILKSTSWFWWPLAYLGGRFAFSGSPHYFLYIKTKSIWAQVGLTNSILILLGFVAANVIRSEEHLPQNAFTTLFFYLFSLDAHPSILQSMWIGIALISVAIAIWANSITRAYDVAEQSANKAVPGKVKLHLGRIERLDRLRLLFSFVLWVLIGIHATLSFNNIRCWIALPPHIELWAEWLYGSSLPAPNCAAH